MNALRTRKTSAAVTPRALRARGGRDRRGAIFITALGIIVILSGLILVFAQSVRTASLESANRLAYLQADAIEQGAEKWVMAQIEAYPGDTLTVTDTPAEAIRVGTGYFWILRANPDNDQQYDFGITDEAGKLNINTASATQLLGFPGMTEHAAGAIVDWRNTSGNASNYDAQYNTLPDAYMGKHSPFETVEELTLVNWSTPNDPYGGVTTDMLYGLDANRDGVVDDAERAAAGTASMFANASGSSRGIAPFVTAYSTDPNTTADGSARINLRNLNQGGTRQSLQTALGNALGATRATAVMNAIGNASRFTDLGTFYRSSGMTAAEFAKVFDLVTTRTGTPSGLVNVLTAPRDVLLCLNMSDADADAVITAREGAASSSSSAGDLNWFFTAVNPATVTNVANLITNHSYQYSADIVAVSGDGRAFKRVRIVVDARTTPTAIVYRKDLTGLGWPLPADVRTSLRAGNGVVSGYARTGGGVGGRISF